MYVLRICILISIVCLVAQPVSAGRKKLRKRIDKLENRANQMLCAYNNLSDAQIATKARLDDVESIVQEIKDGKRVLAIDLKYTT